MDKRVTYTHFGHTKFDKENFKEIKNRPMCIKPSGGFWASRTDAKYGWKEWNENNCFSACNNNNKIVFQLSDSTRVLELHTVDDAKRMKTEYGGKNDIPNLFDIPFFMTIDFEKMKEDYDAVEYFVSDDWGLYDEMYGWDCDSILILNPDVVQQINLEKDIADEVLEDEMKDVSFVTENDKEKSL